MVMSTSLNATLNAKKIIYNIQTCILDFVLAYEYKLKGNVDKFELCTIYEIDK